MYGGLIDRVHDLMLCGVDPSLVEFSERLDHLESNDSSSDECEDRETDYCDNQETESLLRAASLPWTPSYHAYLYGPEFRACIASVCLVKVYFLCMW